MKELKFDAKVEELDAVLAFLDTELESLDCPMKVQTELDLAVEELFVNIANYAYGDKTGYALMKFAELENARGVSITFVDEGMQYNPLERPDPDVTLPAEERPVGGLGIFLVKKIADEVNYNYSDGKNIFNFIKKF
ncbi:MAG: ATP-binding protein [Synergistaceae bacterium]|nr:ATP-binding protein [Synergistaceae bacterium]